MRLRVLAGLLGLALAGCQRSTAPPPNQTARNANILLITLDTTRADHIGCFAGIPAKASKTPRLDALAARGVRFDHATAQAPLTLPSHASIMTGAYPTVHGVRDMEGFVLDPAHPTLATILQARGFSTAAVVGARVLAATFGLSRGFVSYDDNMGSQPDPAPSGGAVAERRAEVVTQHALDWLQQNGRRKFFLWAHYFDPHAPYNPPEPFKRTYAHDLYSGEIAYMDQEVGRVLDGLRQMGLEDRTLVAVVGDHGESLGEHGEMTHGVFLYDATLHVPLILAGPGAPPGKVISSQVRSIDLMPTLLAFLDLSPGAEAQGVSLWPRISKDTALPAPGYSYAETLYPRTYMGWSELRAMRTESWKLILAPHPELYNLDRDPAEKRNLYAEKPAEADRLRSRLSQVATNLGRVQKIEVKPQAEKTLRELKTLGYVGAGTRREIQLGTNAPDPKDRIAVLKLFARFEDLLAEKNYTRAALVAEEAYRLDDTNPRGHLYLATAYEETGQYQRAIAVLQHAVTAGIQTDRIYSRLGIDHLRLQQTDQAIDALEHAARLNPSEVGTIFNLGMAYLQRNRSQDAEKAFRAIVAQDANYAGAHNGLGILAAQRGDTEGARREFQTALDADPKEIKSLLDLGILFQNIGDRKQSLHYLRLYLDRVPRGQSTPQIAEVRQVVREMEDEERKSGARQ